MVVGERDGGLRLGREETGEKESTEGVDGHGGGGRWWAVVRRMLIVKCVCFLKNGCWGFGRSNSR